MKKDGKKGFTKMDTWDNEGKLHFSESNMTFQAHLTISLIKNKQNQTFSRWSDFII